MHPASSDSYLCPRVYILCTFSHSTTNTGDDDKPQAAHTPSTPPPAAATGSDSSDTPAASKPPANVAGAGGRAGDELQVGVLVGVCEV